MGKQTLVRRKTERLEKKGGGIFLNWLICHQILIRITGDICNVIPRNFPTTLSGVSTESVMCQFLFCPQLLEYSDYEDVDLFQ